MWGWAHVDKSVPDKGKGMENDSGQEGTWWGWAACEGKSIMAHVTLGGPEWKRKEWSQHGAIRDHVLECDLTKQSYAFEFWSDCCIHLSLL